MVKKHEGARRLFSTFVEAAAQRRAGNQPRRLAAA
jgi:hypothetical protein